MAAVTYFGLLLCLALRCGVAAASSPSNVAQTPANGLFENLRQTIKRDPHLAFEQLLTMANDFNVISAKSNPTLMAAAAGYLKDDSVVTGAINAVDKMEEWFVTEDTLPLLQFLEDAFASGDEEMVKRKGMQVVQEQLAKAGLQLSKHIEKESNVRALMRSISRYIIQGYSFVQSMMDDTMRLAVVNGLLVSKNFPPLNRFDQINSIALLLQQAVAVFTTYSPDDFPIASMVKTWSAEFEHHYFTFDRFQNKLTDEQRETVITEALFDTVAEPLKDIKDLYNHLLEHKEDCPALALCVFNENFVFHHRPDAVDADPTGHKHQGRVNKMQSNLVALLSDFLVNAWSRIQMKVTVETSPEATWLTKRTEQLYEAVRAGQDQGLGSKRKSCKQLYGAKSDGTPCTISSDETRTVPIRHTEL